MNKVTLALAAATAGLMLLSVHLWRQLDTERNRTQQNTQLQTSAANAKHDQPVPARNAATPTTQTPPQVARTVIPPDQYREQQRRRQEARKRILDDPRERERLKEVSRQSIRAANSDLAQQLRGELSPGDALTEQQNRQLLAALQKERASFNEDMQQRVPSERRIGGRSLWNGAKLILDSASTLPAQEQFLRQAEEFVRRQRQHAAEILNERQLRVFVRMQDQLLARERLETRTTTLVEQGI